MKKLVLFNLLIIFSISAFCGNKNEVKAPERLDWWRDARFGLFIHWGLYSIPAGEWKEKTDYGEWIRDKVQIPLSQYDEFAPKFNPVKFNAEEWVVMAKNAGMKYIVITTKHHDGFCLFDSKETDFDVMSTPFKRDAVKELSVACTKHGLTLCFYHSIMDWHHPDYLPRRTWETDRPVEAANMEDYITYMKNQLKELLTNYGRIGVLWFDGEWENTWTHERGKDLYDYCRKLQPDIIINNRIDVGRNGMEGQTKDSTFCGDFGTPEQEIPLTGLPGVDWESCMTMNEHWGYNKMDQKWKSSEDMIRKLIDSSSKGGNLLLNVGPTSEGLFPETSISRLRDMGEWIKENGEAIYGTQASPFGKLDWGRCTQKTKRENTLLFLHVFDWPKDGKLIVPGLKNRIIKAHCLKDKGETNLAFKKDTDNSIAVNIGGVSQSRYATVIVLEIKGKPVVNW
jgi:alpha-L-fucosidase